MKIRLAVPVVSGFLLLATAIVPAFGQAGSARAPGAVAACGAPNVMFKVKKDGGAPTQPPAGKALVYLIQNTQGSEKGLLDSADKVRMGVDGKWVGATQDQTYMSFVVDPGMHHLCTSYQGDGYGRISDRWVFGMQEGIVLHQLNAEAGKTYYFRFTDILIQTQTHRANFLDEVDEDEARFLMQTLPYVTSSPK